MSRKISKIIYVITLPNLPIYTNSDNLWHKDGKQSKIIWGALIFHLN